MPTYISIVIGSSTKVLNEASHFAPVAPSTTRWSQVRVSITIQDSDEASSVESEFDEDEYTSSKKVHQTSTVQQEFPENDEGSTFPGKLKAIKSE